MVTLMSNLDGNKNDEEKHGEIRGKLGLAGANKPALIK
jgi:hypothetical protein